VSALRSALVVRRRACLVHEESANHAHVLILFLPSLPLKWCQGKECITRTTLRGRSRRVCGVTTASREAIFDILYALGLVWIREPVLAHVEIIAETYRTSSHE
jgi:hypothetical protein